MSVLLLSPKGHVLEEYIEMKNIYLSILNTYWFAHIYLLYYNVLFLLGTSFFWKKNIKKYHLMEYYVPSFMLLGHSLILEINFIKWLAENFYH